MSINDGLSCTSRLVDITYHRQIPRDPASYLQSTARITICTLQNQGGRHVNVEGRKAPTWCNHDASIYIAIMTNRTTCMIKKKKRVRRLNVWDSIFSRFRSNLILANWWSRLHILSFITKTIDFHLFTYRLQQPLAIAYNDGPLADSCPKLPITKRVTYSGKMAKRMRRMHAMVYGHGHINMLAAYYLQAAASFANRVSANHRRHHGVKASHHKNEFATASIRWPIHRST